MGFFDLFRFGRNRSREEKRRDEEGGCGREWSDLPDLVLYTILKKRPPLSSLRDLFAFAGVCRSWRSVAMSAKSEFAGSHPPLLCTKSKSAFFDIKEEKFYRRRFRVEWSRVIGSSYGYLITKSYFRKSNLREVALADPFAGVVQHTILLPSHVLSVKLSSPPPRPPAPDGSSGDRPCVVAAICPEYILCCPLGDSKWTSLSRDPGGDRQLFISNAGFFRGRLYGRTCRGDLFAWDPVRPTPSWTHVGFGINSDRLFPSHCYLFESSGELLSVGISLPFVGRHRAFERRFVVERFDFLRSGWVPLNDLGSRSLFLDLDSDVYLDDDPTRWGGAGNCIYYVEGLDQSLCLFHMEDGRVEDLLPPSSSDLVFPQKLVVTLNLKNSFVEELKDLWYSWRRTGSGHCEGQLHDSYVVSLGKSDRCRLCKEKHSHITMAPRILEHVRQKIKSFF